MPPKCLRNKKKRACVYISIFLACVGLLIIYPDPILRTFHFFRAFLRPLYDSSGKLPPGIPFKGKFENCEEIGLVPAKEGKKVFIQANFNTELELLELQLDELSGIVEAFVVVESNMTFQQKPKELNLKNNLRLFEKWINQNKLIYSEMSFVPEYSAKDNNVWHWENLQRDRAADIIKTMASNGDVVVVIDPDEILSVDAVKVLKYCDGFQEPLFLKTRYFLYSFEFEQILPPDTGPVAHIFRGERTDRRVFQSAVQYLDNSGWHCTFCFKYIWQMVDKVKTYPHADRARKKHRSPEWAQTVACNGMNIFEYFADVYTWDDAWKLITLNSNIVVQHKSLEDLPATVRLYPEKYSYLIPGNCIREDHPDSSNS